MDNLKKWEKMKEKKNTYFNKNHTLNTANHNITYVILMLILSEKNKTIENEKKKTTDLWKENRNYIRKMIWTEKTTQLLLISF